MLVLLVVTLFLCVRAQTVDIDAIAAGYLETTYNVTTSDGYILQLHRLNSKNGSISGKVVFLMHGAPYAYNSFIYAGSKYGIAYNLADAGYDVWLGNARGNKYSRRHVSLEPDTDSDKFYDFTFEEIGLYDIPAMVDFALATTKKDKLHFIGHSLGGTAFLVLNSLNVTYQSKFASAHLLAGLGYETKLINTDINQLADASDVIYNILQLTDNLEMMQINLTNLFLQSFVNTTVPKSLNAETSVKQFIHLGQNVRDKVFARWNYGAAGNMAKYGTTTPPAYALSKVNVSLTLHYSVSDSTQSEADVLAMAKTLPNAVARKVARDSFGNLDYITMDMRDLVTAFIIQSINNSSM